MRQAQLPQTRRQFLRAAGLAAGFFAIPDAVKESRIGELAAKFDIVLGFTPGIS
jgi:hypothetical protein